MLTIYVVSDATGRTAERVVRSALVQFENATVNLVRKGHVRTPEQIRAVVQEAAGQQAIVFHTLVSDQLRHLMLTETRTRGGDAMDLMGPVLDRLAARLRLPPQEKPGLLSQLIEAKSRQIEAVEFAFRHDDGQNADDVGRAEVVLVGVSRTMKTPCMLYLAYRGWLVANVPLIPELPLPDALLRVPRERVFCLWMAPDRLLELRRARAEYEAIPIEPYASPKAVREELRFAERLCRRYRWPAIDVTGKSVEEVGREIIGLLSGERTGEDVP